MGDILFLAHRIPWPADRGDKIRSHHILKYLASLAPVHVGAFADDDRDLGFVAEMRPIFASVHVELRDKPQWQSGIEALTKRQPVSVASFASDTMQNWVDERLASGSISQIFVFSGQMAQFVPASFTGRVIMDFVDVDSAKFESYAGQGNPLMRWINAREGRRLSLFEHDMARRADASLFVSEAEAALFRSRSDLNDVKVCAVGNGIDTEFYDPNIIVAPILIKLTGPLIIFTGQMDYRPNIEAVCDFAQNAMPKIQQRHKDAIFAIVGRNPAAAVTALASKKGVIVTGAVDDVRSWLHAADVVVAPLRIARGIQNKVLEAMAMAKPVVASHAAAEGIDAQDGIHFYVAHDVGEDADLVCQLLDFPDKQKRIGIAARMHVKTRYSWDGQLAMLQSVMGMPSFQREAAE